MAQLERFFKLNMLSDITLHNGQKLSSVWANCVEKHSRRRTVVESGKQNCLLGLFNDLYCILYVQCHFAN